MSAAQRLLPMVRDLRRILFTTIAAALLVVVPATAKPAAPAKSPTKTLASAVEAVIVADSESWLFKVYKPGSVRDVTVAQGDEPGVKIVGATYSYADGSSTWIKVLVRKDGGVQCIAYGDEYFTGCRAVGDNPAIGLISNAIMSTATAPRDNATCPNGYVLVGEKCQPTFVMEGRSRPGE